MNGFADQSVGGFHPGFGQGGMGGHGVGKVHCFDHSVGTDTEPADVMYNNPMRSIETTQTAPLTLWEDGSIRVGGSRVPLDSIVHEFTRGATAEQIQDDFPSLSLREIYGAISYYLERQDQVEEYLQRREEEAANVRRQVEDPPKLDALRRRVRDRIVQLRGQM